MLDNSTIDGSGKPCKNLTSTALKCRGTAGRSGDNRRKLTSTCISRETGLLDSNLKGVCEMGYPCWRIPGVHWLLRVFLIFLAVSSFLSLIPAASSAAAGVPALPVDVEAEAEYARAAVTLDGEKLFFVRGIQAFPAEKRATAIGDRLRAVAADRTVPIESLRAVEKPYGSDILAGDRF